MIDYKLLDESIEYYKKCGYDRIESPWMVSEYVDNITKPKHIQSYQLYHNQKCLVASGEQSFLYLYLKNYLPKGQFQTITPCFRYDQFDSLHCNSFMKNELIKTDVVTPLALEEVIDKAHEFFKLYIPDTYVIQTAEGFDIEVDGKELGSYGIRSCDFLDWIYGTACAEPRTSTLIKQYAKK